ncbi:MAG: amidohydrolase family protein [Candidatus Brockarchaeota archaeon]|nr:amidohydrolase family protein [Candidatus Brockarchaeota archaeon]
MKNDSELAREFLENGRSSSCPVIDMHGHYGPFQGIYFPSSSAEAMVKTMDRAGVRMIVCSSHASLIDPGRGNPLMAEVVKKYPDRFRAYWAVNPNYPKIIERDLLDYEKREGFVGFKFLADYHKYPITGPNYRPVLEYANRRGLLVLVHTWGHSEFDSPSHLAEIAERYPEAKFLMGHSGYGEWEKSVSVSREHANVYLELTAAYAVNGYVEKMVNEAGSEKILFGTDLPWFDPHYGIGCILFSRIDDGDRHDILHRNAEKLLGL